MENIYYLIKNLYDFFYFYCLSVEYKGFVNWFLLFFFIYLDGKYYFKWLKKRCKVERVYLVIKGIWIKRIRCCY